jgi:hypothetical protein
MTRDRLERYLDPDEHLLGRWTGTVTDGWRSQRAVVCPTDRRLVALTDDGFTQIAYDHVSAVESRREVDSEIEGLDYRLVVAAGAALAVVAVVAAVTASSGALALALVVLAVGGAAAVEYGWEHRDDLDGFRRRETERRLVTVTTGDGRSHEFSVDADAELDAVLARAVDD